MDLLSQLPVWGQWSVLGILVSIIVFVLVRVLTGELVPRKQLDAVQATADSWQKAWETAMQVQASTTLVLERVNVLADTMQHFLEALPAPAPSETDGEH